MIKNILNSTDDSNKEQNQIEFKNKLIERRLLIDNLLDLQNYTNQ